MSLFYLEGWLAVFARPAPDGTEIYHHELLASGAQLLIESGLDESEKKISSPLFLFH